MTKEQKIAATRWTLVPVAAILGFITAVFAVFPMNRLIHGILWSHGHAMPGKSFIAYVLPYDGGVAASMVLLFGSLMAPAYRRHAAAILLIVGALFAWGGVGNFYSPNFYFDGPKRLWWPIIGTYLGGLATFAILFVTFRSTKAP